MMEMKNSGILVVNVAVIAAALLSLSAVSYVQPVYPFDGTVTDDRTPSFEWTGWNGEYDVLIDDDRSFSSPMIFAVEGRSYTLEEELDFGTYWWKVSGNGMETKPVMISIVSSVSLSRPEDGAIANTGNTPLLIHRSGITGAVTLPVNESIEIGDDNVKAEQVY